MDHQEMRDRLDSEARNWLERTQAEAAMKRWEEDQMARRRETAVYSIVAVLMVTVFAGVVWLLTMVGQ